MLELGKAGSHGCPKGVLPVLRDDEVVATLRASTWKEAATVSVGGVTWEFTRRKRELTGRRAGDPEDAVRLRARQVSVWKGTWAIDLEGTAVEVRPASWWKGTHRFLVHGRPAAESGSTPGWMPRATITLDGTLPLEQQLFLLWWEHVMRRRSAAAAA
ncbi:hypothetical protein [Blastococcus xanthinilyticus]|uniref:Uncharacterized protein n=1 Tax=Blastococcus xanthinilyticus TaxID=1564164 RepID=A0A5S5CX87_9ACTN|nr:hypothetical protein [Blastococcus xanthinilyticus]TYP87466.1 hypothetical protein BD833_10654 [Blastococcus xanthinilyticus]